MPPRTRVKVVRNTMPGSTGRSAPPTARAEKTSKVRQSMYGFDPKALNTLPTAPTVPTLFRTRGEGRANVPKRQ